MPAAVAGLRVFPHDGGGSWSGVRGVKAGIGIAGRGRIELVCGPMFSGKTELLLRRLVKARAQSVPTAVFKHACDDRYHHHQLVAHSGERTAAVAVASAAQMLELAGEARLILIDEGQFFGIDLVSTCRQFADGGRTVIVAGLDRDSWGQPFGVMPHIERIADRVTRTTAKCAVCGGVADHTQRIAPISGPCMIGGPEAYEPPCAKCFVAPPLELRR